MRVHAVRLGPEYLVFLLIVLFAVPQDGLAACVRSGLMPILTRVTTAINSSMACERWCLRESRGSLPQPRSIATHLLAVLVGDGSGHCQLQLACDPRHILTLARISSLLNTLQACRVQPIVQASRSRRDLASSKARMERRAE